MLDRYNRRINYLRISVTDKCNLRCTYCMPEEGVPLKSHCELLSFEEIVEIAKQAVKIGIDKIRLTGGEPLVKKDIVKLVSMLSSISDLQVLSMTTNATLLKPVAGRLKKAGLTSINISLDTLEPDKYFNLTRGGDINKVLSGINAALEYGFPVKLNMVVINDFNEDEIPGIEKFCNERNIVFQPINKFNLLLPKNHKYFYQRPPMCEECNRIRLLCDGTLKPCLHSDKEIKVDFSDIKSSLIKTIQAKPEKGSVCNSRQMIQIGG